jgi:putative phosphoesterase
LLIAVISDTHIPRGRRRLPDFCRERLAGSDLIIHAGDLTSAVFLDELRGVGPPVRAIHGNADESSLRDVLPEAIVFKAAGATIAVVHDAGPPVGREARLARRFAGSDAIIYGHTHLPQVERHDSTWVLNPGSPTERRRARSRSMLLLEIQTNGTIRPEILELPFVGSNL